MECEHCEQVSDWIGDQSEWTAINDGAPVTHGLYECERCGHRQRAH
ncbi:hypothetical protein [Halostella pelagica]|nr:hypothetical protein [Halostella pelagica]